MSYNIVSKYIKDISFEIPNTKAYVMLEKEISNYVGCKFAVAVSSCTAGMHIACKALGFNKDSILLTSAISFVSSANVARFLGGKVDFVDIDPNTVNMNLQNLENKIKKNRPKIVIPVHMGGYPCEMNKIKKLSKIYNFKIIEDAAHALGAKYNFSKKKGAVTQTILAQIDIIIHHKELNNINLFVRRSFSEHLMSWIDDAASRL